MSVFKDHPVKVVIREKWCKPLIKHLYENLGYKLSYLGLPGLEAIDILTWIDYLNNIIAFDIGDYSKEYNDEVAKKNISKLYGLLSELETRGLIDNFSLYHGYIEEVVLKGIDRNRSKFSQYENITIYNLDFCNLLTVPLNLTDPLTGESYKYYKTEVIRKLLEIQRELSMKGKSTKFIFYLTIHSMFWENEAERVFDGNELYPKYYQSLDKCDPHHRNIRLLRFYIFDIIKTHFSSNQFIPEFLPTLYYQGTGENMLLCFTVVGTFFKSPSCIAPFYQNIEFLINEKFLQPNEKDIYYFIQDSVNETNCILDPVDAIKELRSYKEKWI